MNTLLIYTIQTIERGILASKITKSNKYASFEEGYAQKEAY
jgi:hypothetical protein